MTRPTTTTVAIPMHASRPFVDVISANIAALPHDVEIVLSDRTSVDDAIDCLRERHGDDPRVRFVASSEGLGIIDHYNALLRDARGDYFMWMPHDDSFPSDYVPLLRAALDAKPDANLAFGRVRPIDLDGAVIPDKVKVCGDPPIELGSRTRADEAIYLWGHWSIWIPYRGLMRRPEVLHRKLFLRHGLQEYWHDIPWVFAMTVVAPIVFVPECVCEKRFHDDSHHVPLSERRAVDELADIMTVARYMVSARVGWIDATKAMRYTILRASRLAAWHLPDPIRALVPARLRRAAKRVVTPA